MLAALLALLLSLFLPPCPTEDSTMCTWDAAVQGNGLGHSFVALSDDLILYLNS